MYEFWLSKWELITINTRFYVPYILAFLALVFVVIYVMSRIYGIGKPSTRCPPSWLIFIFIFVLLILYGIDLTAPEKMGFAVGGGKLVVDMRWWGLPSGKVYNLSDCSLEWINASTTRI